jgi:AraC family transcriptional regulator
VRSALGKQTETSIAPIRKGTEFDAFLRGPSRQGISSRGLGWKGFVIEEHRAEAGERPERVTERHILVAWSGRRATGEYQDERGIYIPYTNSHGTFGFLPAGIVPAVRPHGRSEITLCALDPQFVNGVEEAMEQKPSAPLRFRTGFHEATLLQLITLLLAEAARGGTSGRLYADHLAQALTTRILLLGDRKKSGPRPEASVLPRHLLQRVVERMHDLDTDLDLQTLAAETGYSRAHFLRMFHAATGLTPYRYLLQLRLTRAKELIQQRYTSLIDVALACGFSSHAHMSRVFRRLLGVSPSEYRESL